LRRAGVVTLMRMMTMSEVVRVSYFFVGSMGGWPGRSWLRRLGLVQGREWPVAACTSYVEKKNV